jgi:hypothetical protein
MLKVAPCIPVVVALAAIACSGHDDPLTQASQYATDPIPCVQDSDCCVVNDGCHSTAYLVASKDSAQVASLVASADDSTCDRCVTPMIQASCVSGMCVGERIGFSCSLPMGYPGNHCGKLEVPASCFSSSKPGDLRSNLPEAATSKPLAIFRCGG